MNAQRVEVYVTDIRSTEGLLVIGIFKDYESFKKDEPFKRLKYKKTSMTDGKMKVVLELEPGTYGLALLDDENNDDKMNFNLIGIPKEGYGFSDYVLKSISRPRFEDFNFVVKPGQSIKVLCKMKYML